MTTDACNRFCSGTTGYMEISHLKTKICDSTAYIFNAFPCVGFGKASFSPTATGYLCATAATFLLQNITYHENHKRNTGQRNPTNHLIHAEFEVSSPVLLLLLLLGWCLMKIGTLSHVAQGQRGWLAFVETFAMFGTTFDYAGVLFPPVAQGRLNKCEILCSRC